MGANGLFVAGNITQAGGKVTSTGTITLNGTAGAQSVDFTNSTVANLTVDNTYVTAPQVSITTAATITGNLVLTQGTLALATAGSANYVIDGNVSGAGTLDAHLVASGNSVTVGGYVGTSGAVLAALVSPRGHAERGGNWNVTALTYNNGTVSFTGAGPHTLYAGANFYNLSYTRLRGVR